MASPLPSWPRGKRRKRVVPEELLLGCPRLSPEFELSTIRALMKPKPHTRAAVQHRDGLQPWPRGVEARINKLLDHLRALGAALPMHRTAAGEFHLVASFAPAQLEEAKAIAITLSLAAPDHWFVLDRLFVRDGRFYRRRFGYQLQLILATNVHLTRPMRALVRQATALTQASVR